MTTINFANKLGLVGITASQILDHVKEAIKEGSKRDQLSWSDFTFTCNNNSGVTISSTFEEMVTGGVPYLDAVVLKFAANVPPNTVINQKKAIESKPVNYLDIARGLFAWYFSLYSQGKSVGSGSNNFLTSVVNFGNNWPDLVNSLTSANINNFPKSWVKDIKINELDEPARNRLALGAGGQRFLQALNYIADSDFMAGKEEEKKFVAGLRDWTKSKVYWDLHPLYKSGNIITVTKSLNKSIEDCLFHGLTAAGKKKLTDSKILYETPKEQPAHAQWRTLNLASLPQLTQPIF